MTEYLQKGRFVNNPFGKEARRVLGLLNGNWCPIQDLFNPSRVKNSELLVVTLWFLTYSCEVSLLSCGNYSAKSIICEKLYKNHSISCGRESSMSLNPPYMDQNSAEFWSMYRHPGCKEVRVFFWTNSATGAIASIPYHWKGSPPSEHNISTGVIPCPWSTVPHTDTRHYS